MLGLSNKSFLKTSAQIHQEWDTHFKYIAGIFEISLNRCLEYFYVECN